MADLHLDHIRRFADWLRQERGSAVSTTNARIAAGLPPFFRAIGYVSP